MPVLTRCRITVLVIRGALVPTRAGSAIPAPPVSGCLTVSPESILSCLADLGRSVDPGGRLALFFPGCLAFAAPAVLFRLKREGYSNCRATATAEGLLVEATR